MFFIYQLIISIIIFFSPFIIIFRIINGKEDKIRFKEKFCFFSKKNKYQKLIWFHGSSVGELMSIIPIISEYEKNSSVDKILVTSSTLSSSKIIKKYKFKKVIHQFYPIDHNFFSKKFINYWKPKVAIFLESEIWPSMFQNLKKRNIPLILLNARISKKSFKRWNRFKKFSEFVFNLIDYAYPQNSETGGFLKKFKLKKIRYIGNLKFIEDKKNKQDVINKKLYLELKKRKIFIAASTHSDEEKFASKAHLLLKKSNKKLLTIIIPRHIERTKKISIEVEKLGLNVIYHSSGNKKLDNADIYIVDTFGESKKFYKIASTVFLGGSIVKRGGQNPLEPARYGAKILHGPHIENFSEIYSYLKSLKISKKIETPNQLASSIKYKKNVGKTSEIKNLGDKIFKNTVKELDKIISNET